MYLTWLFVLIVLSMSFSASRIKSNYWKAFYLSTAMSTGYNLYLRYRRYPRCFLVGSFASVYICLIVSSISCYTDSVYIEGPRQICLENALRWLGYLKSFIVPRSLFKMPSSRQRRFYCLRLRLTSLMCGVSRSWLLMIISALCLCKPTPNWLAFFRLRFIYD